MNRLLQFAKDTKEINPNLLKDIESGLIKPCGVLDKAMERYYKKKDIK